MRIKISLGIKYPSRINDLGLQNITVKLKSLKDRSGFECLSHRDDYLFKLLSIKTNDRKDFSTPFCHPVGIPT